MFRLYTKKPYFRLKVEMLAAYDLACVCLSVMPSAFFGLDMSSKRLVDCCLWGIFAGRLCAAASV